MFAGVILAVALLRAAWARREQEALSSNDLRALEESAVILIEQLKAEVDGRIVELDAKSAELRKLTREADLRIEAIREAVASSMKPKVASAPEEVPQIVEVNPVMQKVIDMAESGVDSAEIARIAGMDFAEVKLMLRLSGVGKN